MNLLHDIDPGTPEKMNVIIEIPKGSHNKYELDKELGIIKLDRVMHTAQEYPFDYGFVPQTLWDDGDPVDVVLLTTYPLAPGIIAEARPIGILHMIDSNDPDEKIIAVPVKDPRFAHLEDIKDANQHTLKEISHFFLTYKQLQGKEVTLDGFEGREAALAAVTRARKLYDDGRK